MAYIIKGIIISSTTPTQLVIHNPGFMVVDEQGIIQDVTSQNPQSIYPNYPLIDHSKHLIVPGFIDLHNHLPQFAYAGLGAGQLLEWLEKYTFPREQQFTDAAVAQKAAHQFFSSLIAAGTTTTVTYVTIHEQATDIAFDVADKIGIRAIIGKVMMDQQAPTQLQETSDKALATTERLIQKWHGKNQKLFYAITPRFAITCSPKMLEQTAALAKRYDTYIQTHLAENQGEIEAVKTLFPTAKHYTDVYHQAGLLGPKTIMAHCIHLNDEEKTLLQATQTIITHCPTSNRFLMSGIMPTRHYLNANMRIGLGTDVAGGYSHSMLHEMRECIETSKQLSFIDDTHPLPISLEECFYLATRGGAEVLGLENIIGSLEPGKAADFVILDPAIADPWIWENDYHDPRQLFAKCVYATSGNPVVQTYVEGKKLTSP